MKKISLLAMCFYMLDGRAQDINFSQFYELPLLRNPALAGTFRGDIRATAAFRSQWNSVTVPYRTQALGVEMKSDISQGSSTYLSYGIQITNDMAGDSRLGRTQMLPMLALHQLVSPGKDGYISVGFLAGPVQQSFDQSKLRFDDQFVGGSYSATNPTHDIFGKTNVTYFELAAGVKYSASFGYNNAYYIGAGVFHLRRPTVAFSEDANIVLNKKFVVNAGLSAATSDYDRVIFYLDYFKQGGHGQAQGGVLYKHDLLQEDIDYIVSVSGGAFIRWNDAIIPVLKLDYYNLAVGLTYDVNISKLTGASGARGGFEVSLSYSNFLNIRNSSAEKVRCPVSIY